MMYMHAICAWCNFPADVSSLDKSIASLERAISSGEASSALWEHLLWLFTGAVVVGVSFDLWVVIKEYLDARKAWLRDAIQSPKKPTLCFFVFELLAILLITIGVSGELVIGVVSGNINTDLRDKNRSLVGLIQKKTELADMDASCANDRATEASERATLASGQALAASRSANLANDRASELATENIEERRKSDELAALLQKANDDRVELESSLRPRALLSITDVNGKQNTDELKPFRGVEVFIEATEDGEAVRAAKNLRALLLKCGWIVIPPIAVKLPRDECSPDCIPDGVTVERYFSHVNLIPRPESTPSGKAADALVEFLNSSHWKVRAYDELTDSLKPNQVKISVGFKPEPYFDPAIQKELDRRTDEIMREVRKRLKIVPNE